MPYGLYDAVINENIDKIKEYSKQELLEPTIDGNIFLFAARKGKVKSAKAIIDRLNETEISLRIDIPESIDAPIKVEFKSNIDIICNFISAKSTDHERNAWMLAAIANSTDFLNYLYSLKEEYRNFLLDWDEFQLDTDGFSAIDLAIILRRDGVISYFFKKGCIADNEESSHDTVFWFNGYLNYKGLEFQAEMLLETNFQGINLLPSAIYNDCNKQVAFIHRLVQNWFEADSNELKLLPDYLLKGMFKVYLDYYLDKLDLSTQEKRKMEARKLIFQKGGYQSLKTSKIYSDLSKRPYRSFKSERERQLLRQIATQIYHGFKLSTTFDSKELVEVQLMHLSYKGKYYLFVAANESSVAINLYNYLMDKPLEDTLTTPYFPPGSAEGEVRSARYAKKIKERLYGKQIDLPNSEYIADAIRANVVAEIVKKGNIKRLPIKLVTDCGKNNASRGLVLTQESKSYIRHALKAEPTLYIVTADFETNTSTLRHAEEFLVDIRDSIEGSQNLYTSIGGKKRPCIGCSSRMRNKIDQYGRYPGGFWLNTIETQSPAVARNTLKLLFTKSSHVSCRKDNTKDFDYDYDSGSDSDIEPNNII